MAKFLHKKEKGRKKPPLGINLVEIWVDWLIFGEKIPNFWYHKIEKKALTPSMWLCKWTSSFYDTHYAILCYSQSGDYPQEYLARFGYNLNYESNFFKKNPFIFLVSYFEPCIIEIWRFFLKFGRIMAIEKLQKHMILAN